MADKGHGMLIALGAPRDRQEPDGDEADEEDDDGLGDHEYQAEADDVFEALKSDDKTAFAHALEMFVKKCME